MEAAWGPAAANAIGDQLQAKARRLEDTKRHVEEQEQAPHTHT